MAEYIEREKALEILERSMNFSKTELDKGEFQKGCIAAIKDDISNIKHMPSADVVPRERYNRAMDGLKAVLEERAEDKVEVAREIFEEIEKHLFVIAPIEEFDGWARIQLADIMRLKKKYTEEKK